MYRTRFLITGGGDRLRPLEVSDIAYFYFENKITFAVTYSGQEHVVDLSISIVGFDNNTVTIKVAQKENDLQKYLSAKELQDRVMDIFDGILPDGIKLHVGAIPYTPDNMPDVTIEWVKEQQAKFGLTDSDLAKSVNIDNANLHRIFNQRGLTKIHKALFYYFFRVYELQSTKISKV